MIAAAPHRIDLISDFVCPWCYIGKHSLDAALGDTPVELRWHPYYLNPGIAAGVARSDYIRAKFGSIERARELAAGVETAAREAGLELDLSKVHGVPNTQDAHRLMRWAAGAGFADAVARALFAAHFDEGADIADAETLVEIAVAVGMDGALVRDLLRGDADCEAVADQAERARDAGINGVPSFVLNGKLLVVGAQSASVLREALAQSLAQAKPA